MTYCWKCLNCGEVVEVSRPMDQHSVEPETHEHSMDCARRVEGWERVITAPSIKTGDGFKC